MSYILDALKKMEHEKAKKKAAGGMTSISGDLFRPDKIKPQKLSIWKTVVAVLVVAIIASVATMYFFGDKPLSRQNKTAKTGLSAPAVQSPPPELTPVVPVVTPAPVSPVPVSANTAQPAPPAAAIRQSSGRDNVKSVQTPVKLDSVPNQGIAPPADIKVSGIAWQDDRKARRAVVNGFLLKEGAVVGGAKIVEIMPEKVRFNASGKIFELSMHSSDVGGAAK